MSRPSGFDRVRPRASTVGVAGPGERLRARRREDGVRSLYSGQESCPAAGSVVVDCDRCGARSVLGPLQAVRAAVPGFHLPTRHGLRSWARCPACGRRTWLRAVLQVPRRG